MNKQKYFINSPDNIFPDNLSTSILRKSKAHDFHRSQKAYTPTPLLELPELASSLGIKQVYLKDESHRMGMNAFKGVGAFYAIDRIICDKPDVGTLITATDGNHGRAVARSASEAGKEAIVFVPEGTSRERIQAIEAEGASLRVVKGDYDEACRLAAEYSKERGCVLVQDTASPGYEKIPANIMAGYLTIFQEMEDCLNKLPTPEFDLLVLQAGVGSFAAAATWYYVNRYGLRRPKILLVEPGEADAVIYSLEKGRWSTSKASSITIMAGLNCNTPSTSALEILKHGSDYAIRITDDHSKTAIRTLYYPKGTDKKIYSGESGAAGLAGLIALVNEPEYSDLKEIAGIDNSTRVLLINTEGPTDHESFNNIIRHRD